MEGKVIYSQDIEQRQYTHYTAHTIQNKDELREVDLSSLEDSDSLDRLLAEFVVGLSKILVFDEVKYRDVLPHPSLVLALSKSNEILSGTEFKEYFFGTVSVQLESELVWPIPKLLA